jgi:DNA-binding transcriptional regulator YiaG
MDRRVETAAGARPTTRDRTAGPMTSECALTCHEDRTVMLVRHLTETDLARRWRMSVRTLQAWRWRKVGPPYLKVLYRLTDIETFEAERLQCGDR